MGIIVHSQDIEAAVTAREDGLEIIFHDPSYVRCERILVYADSRHIGGVLHEGYHDFGALPAHIPLDPLKRGGRAYLSGALSSGYAFHLSAPIQFLHTSTKGK